MEVTTYGPLGSAVYYKVFGAGERTPNMFQPNVSLKEYSHYKIGGPAKHFYVAKNLEDVTKAVEQAKKDKLTIFVLGGGTNLLFSDEGYEGLVLKPDLQVLEAKDGRVRVGAGVSVQDLLNFLISKGLSGLEWAGGLPGTVGGAIRGNAGAFGGETKDSVVEITSLDISGDVPKIVKRTNEEANFGYRMSVYKQASGRDIILEATFNLKPGDQKSIREGIQSKIDYRNERHPMDYPNVGSIFKNVDLRKAPEELKTKFADKIKNDPFPVLPTAILLSEAGLKGTKHGGALISPKHPNFIVNIGNATAADVQSLINLVKSKVKEQFGVELEEEVMYVR